MKTALITGITGQDGSYLAELLLERGYAVWGLARQAPAAPGSGDPFRRVAHILDRLKIVRTDYKDPRPILEEAQPDEIYHLAAQSRVDESFNTEVATFDFNIATTDRLLAAVRAATPRARFYFAATSEMFGGTSESPQNELTPFCPLSPYAVSKTTGFYITNMYRRAYGLHASCGILFNHESPRRPETYLMRKITSAAACIKLGLQKELRLGNLEVKRDWGFAGDYVEAMWRMLQQEAPDDYVIGTGENHSVLEVLETAFGYLDLDWKQYMVTDPSFLRPLEAKALVADASKARKVLGWEAKVGFKELVEMMVAADLKNNEQNK